MNRMNDLYDTEYEKGFYEDIEAERLAEIGINK